MKIKSKKADIEEVLIWIGIILLILVCLFGLYRLIIKLTS